MGNIFQGFISSIPSKNRVRCKRSGKEYKFAGKLRNHFKVEHNLRFQKSSNSLHYSRVKANLSNDCEVRVSHAHLSQWKKCPTRLTDNQAFTKTLSVIHFSAQEVAKKLNSLGNLSERGLM